MTRLIAFLIVAVLLAAAAPARAANPSVIVKWAPGTPAKTKRALANHAGAGSTLGAVRGQNARVLAARDAADAVAARLNRSPDVLYAEPNATLHALEVPDDPLFAQQPDLRAIHAPAAWEAAGLGGFPAAGGPLVGIVDSGVDSAHEDLAGKVAACAASVNGRIRLGQCGDDNGHGTHVAGTIAARAGNGAGIAGVAFASPVAVCKALGGAEGAGSIADVASCIRWLAGKHARVISMSLGGGASTTLETAVNAAWNAGRRGGALLVAAAGNDGNGSVEFPAGYDAVISVAAVDDAGSHAAFSNVNADVEVAAPGVDVLSARAGGGYVRMSGTSMATPHVAGVAALVLTAHPAIGAAELRRRLDASAADAGAAGRDPVFGYGVLDAEAALR